MDHEKYSAYQVSSNLRRKAVASVKKRLLELYQEQNVFCGCNEKFLDGHVLSDECMERVSYSDKTEQGMIGESDGIETEQGMVGGGDGIETEQGIVGGSDGIETEQGMVGGSDSMEIEQCNEGQCDDFENGEDVVEPFWDAWEHHDMSEPKSHEWQPDLAQSLANWAVEFGIKLVALSTLLVLLRPWHPDLPKDARTLLKTKTNYQVSQIKGGMFFYFGILNSLNNTLALIWENVKNGHVFKIQLNFDGLPLFKSSNTQFWPILGLLKGYTSAKPFVIGIFSGVSKPKCLEEYLKSLVEELKTLHSGFIFKGKTFFITVSSVICDAPARAFIKGIKDHSGYYGCDKCVTRGRRINHNVAFPELDAQRRTDESFRLYTDEEHHTTTSPLTNTYIGMVSKFPHDYMHLSCLGVMRKLVVLWSSGPLKTRLQSRDLNKVSENLKQLKYNIPSEFARKPRGLDETCRWKASEWRQFMLYSGPVVLRNVLSSALFQNFMLFSTAMFILAHPFLCMDLNDFAKSLLLTFVSHFGETYGMQYISYNVHGLVHLADDVKEHGHLDTISGFPFENYLGQLKRLVRQPHFPVAQIIRRLSEMESIIKENISQPFSHCLRKEHNHGPVPLSMSNATHQYSELSLESFCIKTSKGDNCVRIGDTIALVRNILDVEGTVVLVYNEFKTKANYFDYPLTSTHLGIFLLSNLDSTLLYTSAVDSVCKYVLLPFKDDFVGIPLIHV